jgi:hypothetical protein
LTAATPAATKGRNRRKIIRKIVVANFSTTGIMSLGATQMRKIDEGNITGL